LDEPLDIGWAEGVLSDGRPYRIECWADDGVTMVTYFVSSKGIEEADDDELTQLLEREGILAFAPGPKHVSASRLRDPSGNDMWSINIVVGDDEDTFVSSTPPLQQYVAAGPARAETPAASKASSAVATNESRPHPNVSPSDARPAPGCGVPPGRGWYISYTADGPKGPFPAPGDRGLD
jgi:hypothetical protein